MLPLQHFTEYLFPFGHKQPLLLFLGEECDFVGSTFGIGRVTVLSFIMFLYLTNNLRIV
jgi:hypothetical protein